MRERPMSLKSASTRRRSRNQTRCRTPLRKLSGPCQKNSETTISWPRTASSSPNWPLAASSPQKSSRPQKKPDRADEAQPQTDSPAIREPALRDHRIGLVGVDAQILDGFV